MVNWFYEAATPSAHHLVLCACLKRTMQAGDKRWFKGTQKEILGSVDSFVVA
jgi:hypothetical protein